MFFFSHACGFIRFTLPACHRSTRWIVSRRRDKYALIICGLRDQLQKAIFTVGAVLGRSEGSTTLNTYSYAVANAQAAAVSKIDERSKRDSL